MLKKLFGSNLKKIRNQKGMTQEELAEKADISTVQIYKIESGKSFVSAELLETLTKVLEVEAYVFFIDSEKTDLDKIKFNEHKEFIKAKINEMLDENI